MSQARADRAAAAGGALSRQPSISASGRSTPALRSGELTPHSSTVGSSSGLFAPPRPSLSNQASFTTQGSLGSSGTGVSNAATMGSAVDVTAASAVSQAMSHYADVARAHSELEIVKAENEALRTRVRRLEQALRTRRESAASTASAAASTTEAQAGSEVESTPATLPHLSPGVSPGTAISEAQIPSSVGPGYGPGAAAGLGAAAGPGNGGAYYLSRTNLGGIRDRSVSAWAAGTTGIAGPRERSESQSTTASSRRGVDEREEVVGVGESAGSAALGGSGR